jgi:capsular polysaccharide transport system permease protein
MLEIPKTNSNKMVAQPGRRAVLTEPGTMPLSWLRAAASHAAAIRKWGLLRLSFLACVLAPTVVALIYVAGFATPQSVSEAKFAVRRASESKMPALPDGLPTALSTLGTMTQSTTQDAFIVTDYIRSRTIIEDLGGKQALYALYSKPYADWWSRLSDSLPLEKVWKYWQKQVVPRIDTQSSIITMEVAAYTPREAQHLGELIVARSEALVNEISERSRHDALVRSENEVRLAQDRLRKAQAALLTFRNRNSAIDPIANATSISETIAKLITEKIGLENDRAGLVGVVSTESPVRRQLDAKISDIDSQVKKLRDQLANQQGGDSTISHQIAGYQDLQLEVQFAEKLYSVAQAAHDQARTEQEKQQLYLAIVEKPTLPEEAYYPRIIATPAVVFAVCAVLWSMIALLIASIRDHMGG